MRTIHWAVLLGSTVLLTGACKKTGRGGTTGSGGGGGAWLVGELGLMANIDEDGVLVGGYDTGQPGNLGSITCRGAHTAFVAGDGGTLLRTVDGGETWDAIDLGTTQALTGVAAGARRVFVVGNGVFEASSDGGDSWQALPGDGTADWRSVATDLDASVAVLVRLDGSIWRWGEDGSFGEMAQLPGARTIPLSYDGVHAAVAGDAGLLASSDDGGLTWTALATGTDADLLGVRATDGGDVLAVGAAGTIVHVDASGIEVTTPGTHTLHAVNLDAEGHAVAAGEGGEVLVSDDRGASWTPGDTLDGTVLGLDFVDAD